MVLEHVKNLVKVIKKLNIKLKIDRSMLHFVTVEDSIRDVHTITVFHTLVTEKQK